jgi:hypothetical protein
MIGSKNSRIVVMEKSMLAFHVLIFGHEIRNITRVDGLAGRAGPYADGPDIWPSAYIAILVVPLRPDPPSPLCPLSIVDGECRVGP